MMGWFGKDKKQDDSGLMLPDTLSDTIADAIRRMYPTNSTGVFQSMYIGYDGDVTPTKQEPITAVESTETVIGYRTYSLRDSLLVGARVKWESNTMQAVCFPSVSHMLVFTNAFRGEPSIPEDADFRQRCLDHMASSEVYHKEHGGYSFSSTVMGCGIYAMKDRAEVDKHYRDEYDCAALGGKEYTMNGPVDIGLDLPRVSIEAETVLYGTVHDCEKGYRATDAKIERLWLMMPREKCGSCGGNLTIAGDNWHCPNVDGVQYTDVAELVDSLKERYQVPVEIGVYRG